MKIDLTNVKGVRLLASLLAVLLIHSCSDSPRARVEKSKEVRNEIARLKPGSSFSDTIIINTPAAIFFNSDSMQLEKIKNVTDPSIFESTVHECFYQMKNSRTVLRENYPGIKIKEVINARYLQFKKTDGKIEYIDLDTLNDPCGLVIFDGRQDPELVDMSNVETMLGFYFSK